MSTSLVSEGGWAAFVSRLESADCDKYGTDVTRAPLFLGIVFVRGSNCLRYICGPSMLDLRLNVYIVL